MNADYLDESENKHSDLNAMLSTIDNPFNPFQKFDEWKEFDTVYGHNTYETLAILGSFGLLQSRLTEAEFDQHVVNTMNELIESDPLGIYIKVWPDTEIKPVNLEKI